MTIQTRKPKIKTTKVTPLDFGEWTHFLVQGSECDYRVAIPAKPLIGKYFGQKYWQYETKCTSTLPGGNPCKGNSNGTVCYHVLAAIKYRVAKRDKVLSLPEDGEQLNAKKLLNLGGLLVKIRNQAGKGIWGAVR